ncbi:MAG: hypothetical protein ACREWI_06255, partial [Telluria sp.]
MSTPRMRTTLCAAFFLVSLIPGCGGSGDFTPPPVLLAPANANVVAYWTDVGAATVNATVATATTPEERRPAFQADMATMHLAIYDAVSAIDGRYKPYLV